MIKNKYKRIYTGSRSGSNNVPVTENSCRFYSKSNYWAWSWNLSKTGSKYLFWTVRILNKNDLKEI